MATNSTTYYNLPVFAATDQPKWLVDWNTTMNIIDGAIAQAKAAGDNAQTTADANALAISGLSDSVSTISTALGTLTTNVTTLTGNVQRINELIGNGTPTTQDKTIIGAINELKAAIDALAPGGEVSAAEVSYDNTDSGLTADDVQDAIDEIAVDVATLDAKVGFPTRLDQGVPQYSADGGATWVNFSSAISVTDVDSEISSSVPITHTLANSHDELLVSCFIEVFGATGSTAELAAATSLTINNPNATLTKFHESTPGIGGSGVSIILQEYHIEGAEAGDVLTFNFNKTYTTIQAEAHIYAIN